MSTLKENVDAVLGTFPQVSPANDVFYNAAGTEAIIVVLGEGWQDLGDDGKPVGDADYFIAVREDGATQSASASWETGFDA